MAGEINIPTNIRFLDETGKPSTPWLLWLLNPRVLTIDSNQPIPPSAGGTGSSSSGPLGQLLVGNGTSYVPTVSLPTSAFPGLVGDVTTPAGSLNTTLATVNADVGGWGSGTAVATFTVNAKGLITQAAATAITGAPGAFTAVGAFGCNGKTAQTSAAANAAIAATAGAAYTATEQGMLNDLKALVNQLRAALIANGVMV